MGKITLKTGLCKIRHSSSEWTGTPKYFHIFWKPMSCRYEFRYKFGFVDIMTSSYWHLNSKVRFWIYDVIFFVLSWGYLPYRCSILSGLLIYCSWDNSLSHCILYFAFWWLHHSLICAQRRQCQNCLYLHVMSMGADSISNLDSFTNISIIWKIGRWIYIACLINMKFMMPKRCWVSPELFLFFVW